ncbi:DUF2867 domain-containing protein [Hoeflea sp.]|uniref:DUF2867 domain-containing protein n=1 Tax=Hoeflea sp. TaxID=1940281 RepID=UPI003B01223E
MKPRPKVTASILPSKSRLYTRIADSDFLDCYSVESGMTPRQAARIITAFPGWARFLVIVRRIVTAPFGLSNDGPVAADKIGPFPVEAETESELIAGFNDKHLDFRVSVFSEDGRVSLATWVHPHNFGGRLYLAVIMPFHILIARNALARVASMPKRSV